MAKLRLALVAIAAAFLVTACQTRWYKTGATQADLDRDSYECERDASRAVNESGAHLYLDCMLAHGWTTPTLIDLR